MCRLICFCRCRSAKSTGDRLGLLGFTPNHWTVHGILLFFNKICTGIFELMKPLIQQNPTTITLRFIGAVRTSQQFVITLFRGKICTSCPHPTGSLHQLTHSHILFDHVSSDLIWHFFSPSSLGILSPETGDQNYCQTCLTLAKQWAADKRACLSRLPLASLHAWHCPRLAWQCPAWHR